MRGVLVCLALFACGPKTAATTRTQNGTPPDASPALPTNATTTTSSETTSTSSETTSTSSETTSDTSKPVAIDAALVTPESDPKKIVGYARVPRQNEDFRADVVVMSIQTSKADERVLWTLALQEDPFAKASAPKKFTLRVELPHRRSAAAA
jgi:hypothetical protein